MPKLQLNSRTCAFLAVCLMLVGCPLTVTPPVSSSDDGSATSGASDDSTPRPSKTSTPTNSTPRPSASPSSSATAAPTPSAAPTSQITRLTILNPIQQMWLPEDANDRAPNSIPSTYSFRVEASTVTGSAVSTSSNVVWSSSNRNILAIDQAGLATATMSKDVKSIMAVTITAATASTPTSATVSATVNLLVGNSGTLEVVIE